MKTIVSNILNRLDKKTFSPLVSRDFEVVRYLNFHWMATKIFLGIEGRK